MLTSHSVFEQVRTSGHYLEEGLKRIAQNNQFGEVGGQGLLWVIDTAKKVQKRLFSKHLKKAY